MLTRANKEAQFKETHILIKLAGVRNKRNISSFCLRASLERACVVKVGVAVHAAGGASHRCVEDFKHSVDCKYTVTVEEREGDRAGSDPATILIQCLQCFTFPCNVSDDLLCSSAALIALFLWRQCIGVLKNGQPGNGNT